MRPVLTARQAHVTNDNDQTTAGHEDAEALAPDLVQLLEEGVVVHDAAELRLVRRVDLKGPVGR